MSSLVRYMWMCIFIESGYLLNVVGTFSDSLRWSWDLYSSMCDRFLVQGIPTSEVYHSTLCMMTLNGPPVFWMWFFLVTGSPLYVEFSSSACFFIWLQVVGIRWSSIFYFESVARVKKLSLSGLLLYKFYKLRIADQFFVQWPQLQKKYPRAHYVGCLM